LLASKSVTFTKYQEIKSNKIKKDETFKAYSLHGKDEKYERTVVG
jgi:hypothetical protein